MRLGMIASALIGIVAVPLVVAAQGPSSSPSTSDGQLRQEMKRTRYVVLPRPPMDTGTRDAQEVADELSAPQRLDLTLREARQRPLLRPDLDHSIVEGIQAQQLNRVRR